MTGVRHVAGLAAAALLALACWGASIWLPRWTGGTWLGDLGLLVLFAAAVALLTTGEWLWTRLSAPTLADDPSGGH